MLCTSLRLGSIYSIASQPSILRYGILRNLGPCKTGIARLSDPSAFRCFPLPYLISSGPLPNQCLQLISMPTSSYDLYRHSLSKGCTNYMLASFSFQCSHFDHLTSPRFCLSNILHPFSPNSLYYQPALVL